MKRPSHRIERVNETIKMVLSEMLLSQIKDPRVGMVTITSVRVSKDFSSAKIYFSVMGDEAQRADTLRGLKSARHFMRGVVADELKLRNSPELRFVYDDTLDRAMAIEEALKKNPPKDDDPEDEPETGD